MLSSQEVVAFVALYALYVRDGHDRLDSRVGAVASTFVRFYVAEA